MSDINLNSELHSISEVLRLTQKEKPLTSFIQIYYYIFLWHFFSSITIHSIAASIGFCTLHKHKFGKYFSIFIVIMGFLLPILPGIVTSGMISFVYVAANFQMNSTVAMLWGICETVVITLIGFTRILATL